MCPQNNVFALVGVMRPYILAEYSQETIGEVLGKRIQHLHIVPVEILKRCYDRFQPKNPVGGHRGLRHATRPCRSISAVGRYVPLLPWTPAFRSFAST